MQKVGRENTIIQRRRKNKKEPKQSVRTNRHFDTNACSVNKTFLPVSFSSIFVLLRIIFRRLICSVFLLFFFPYNLTAGAEKAWNFEQTHKGWLLLHVYASSSAWNCHSYCGNIYVD